MNVCGIIAEYNPFHNGHLFHLKKSRELSDAEYTVVVMSGDFVQRGAPALMDKYVRAQTALTCGADLVLELPSCYATGSAEYFASGAVSLLDQLGVITHLCFGSESGNISPLQQTADILINEPKHFQEYLRSHIRAGQSFPAARTAALLEVCPELSSCREIVSSPNNILGVEYLKALSKRTSSIQPLTLPRSGSGYHNAELTEEFSSASAIRHAIEKGNSLNTLSAHMPDNAFAIMISYFSDYTPVFADDFSVLLHYKLLSEQDKGYAEYLDVSEDFSDRIRNNLYNYTTFTEFCDLLKTKEMTYSRISRGLLHILLNIRKTDITPYQSDLSHVPYARILGLRRDAKPLFSHIRDHSSIPLVSKLADASKNLDKKGLNMLQQDIACHHIYHSVLAGKSHKKMQNEYATPIAIV